MAIPAHAAEAHGPTLMQRAARLQWLTVAHGLIEGVAALIASHGADSVALLGFGLDSLIEVCSATVVLWRLASMARAGRWSISELTGLRLVGSGFLLLSVGIADDAIRGLARHEIPRESSLGIVVALLSVAFMPLLGRAKKRIGGEVGSGAMRADAKQTHFCAFLAGITLVGLALNAGLGWWWADPVAALAMAPIMAWEGLQAWRGKACGCCAHGHLESACD